MGKHFEEENEGDVTPVFLERSQVMNIMSMNQVVLISAPAANLALIGAAHAQSVRNGQRRGRRGTTAPVNSTVAHHPGKQPLNQMSILKQARKPSSHLGNCRWLWRFFFIWW